MPDRDFDEEESNDGLDLISRRNYGVLGASFPGGRQWYCDLAVMLSELEHLRVISFESLDPVDVNLQRFWGEYVASESLRLVVCIDMDFSDAEEVFTMFSAPRVKAVEFERCIIIVDLGYMLGENVNEEQKGLARELTFTDCNFHKVKNKEDRREFARGLSYIPGLRSIKFKRCSFVDAESQRRFYNLLDGSFDGDVVVVED